MDEQMNEQSNETTGGGQEGFAEKVSGETVEFGPGFAVSVSAQQDATIAQAGAIAVSAGRDMNLSYGGGQLIAVGHDLELSYGGAVVVNAGGSVDLNNGGMLVAVSGKEITVQNGFVGAALSSQVNLGEGSTVLLNTPQALVFGAALGTVFALLSWLFRRR